MIVDSFQVSVTRATKALMNTETDWFKGSTYSIWIFKVLRVEFFIEN